VVFWQFEMLALSLGMFEVNSSAATVPAWRGVFAEEAIELSPQVEIRLQAERTLAFAVKQGYAAEADPSARRKIIADAIRFSMNQSTAGPVRRYRGQAGSLRGLFALLSM